MSSKKISPQTSLKSTKIDFSLENSNHLLVTSNIMTSTPQHPTSIPIHELSDGINTWLDLYHAETADDVKDQYEERLVESYEEMERDLQDKTEECERANNLRPALREANKLLDSMKEYLEEEGTYLDWSDKKQKWVDSNDSESESEEEKDMWEHSHSFYGTEITKQDKNVVFKMITGGGGCNPEIDVHSTAIEVVFNIDTETITRITDEGYGGGAYSKKIDGFIMPMFNSIEEFHDEEEYPDKYIEVVDDEHLQPFAFSRDVDYAEIIVSNEIMTKITNELNEYFTSYWESVKDDSSKFKDESEESEEEDY